jgi:hypothetical protein
VSYKLSNQAYLKIILHAAKHPHRPVNGVLLGNMSDSGVLIDDSIPLLHHWTSLSPMMEIGLDLVSFLSFHTWFPRPDLLIGTTRHKLMPPQ